MTRPADFILPVIKPEGPTSHDVVRAVRRELGCRRVGHTGTLDPFASGLLLMCVGRATRLAEYLSALDKTYEAVARLGQATDTLDLEGQVVEERRGWEDLDRGRIEEALLAQRGEVKQVPPAFSAKKVRGEAAHRRVRRGEEVRLEPVAVTIGALELTSLELPLVGLRVTCSSGTYVRALARDIGEALGVGAHLVRLRRTAIGPFGLDAALTLDHLSDARAVAEAAIAPLSALGHLPKVVLGDRESDRLVTGQTVRVVDDGHRGLVAVAHRGSLLAVGESAGGLLRPRKVFAA
ncbi:MAG TPA: tRNA pseudouridine(55) synthase TruB [Longimicrobiales bacterium]|nr:tRNA pseudouridine(55) synthase TruB [Longimicrobiales bacterium]